MKKFKVIPLLALIFTVMFALNGAVMYLLFKINVLDPNVLLKNPPDKDRSYTETEPTDEGRDVRRDPGQSNPVGRSRSETAARVNEISPVGNLSLKDKLKALAILTKINPGDIERIYDMSKDGVTDSEIREITEIVADCLDPSDVEALSEIFYSSNKLYAEEIKK